VARRRSENASVTMHTAMARAAGLLRVGRVSPRRVWVGLAVALLAPPPATVLLSTVRGDLGLGTVLILYLLLVVVSAAIGGIVPALLAAVSSFLLVSWFFTPPLHQLSVHSRDDVVELLVFLVVAAVVSLTVHLAARQQSIAARSRFESQLLARLTGKPVSHLTAEDVLADMGTTFRLSALTLVRSDAPGTALATAGRHGPGARGHFSVDAGQDYRVLVDGREVMGEDAALLARLASVAARTWEAQEFAQEAARARDLAAADRVRAALLAAVGHDLRTPLAGIKAAVSSLRANDVEWAPAEEAELLATIETGADHLQGILANLLDLSRLQTNSLPVHLAPVAVDEVVARALLREEEKDVRLEIPDDLPLVLADPGLLERTVANVVDNARRYSPPGSPVTISGDLREDVVELAVIDHGSGVPSEAWSRLFVPFQRLDDKTAGGHVGLGLAIAQGFVEASGGRVVPSETTGGGLTMTIALPLAPS
jgi:K+-sensing histidine kinase KdpD